MDRTEDAFLQCPFEAALDCLKIFNDFSLSLNRGDLSVKRNCTEIYTYFHCIGITLKSVKLTLD